MTMRISLYIFLVLKILSSSFVELNRSEGCRIRYGKRGCNDKVASGVLVNCDGYDEMSELPISIPEDTVYLSLVNFKFGSFVKSNFSKLSKLQCIHIMDSGIDYIKKDAFTELTQLSELELINTNLTSRSLTFLIDDSFQGNLIVLQNSHVDNLLLKGSAVTQKYKEFRMNGNRIKKIDSSLLSSLLNVETLDFGQNQLQEIDWTKITNLPKLNKLNLAGNLLQTIPRHVINTFATVKELMLGNNPFHCNCRLKWLKEFYEITRDKFLDYEDVTCESPIRKKMIDMDVEDFTCGEPTTPIIHWNYEPSLKEYVVNCSSSSDPAPIINITVPNYQKLSTSASYQLSQTITYTPRVLSGSGKVLCEAFNSVGDSFSIVEIPPVGAAEANNVCLPLITLLVIFYFSISH